MPFTKGQDAHNKAPQSELNSMIEAYLQGKTARQAASPFGRNGSVCLREMEKRGITRRKSGSKIGDANWRKTPQAILDQMVKEYQDGETATRAAAKFGKSKPVCIAELKRRGIKLRARTEKATLDAIIDAYLSGETATSAALKFGKSQIVCLGELKRRGIAPRPIRTGAAEEDVMVEAYLSGKSSEDAAQMVGRTGNVCLRVLKERGIALRPLYSSSEVREGMATAYLEGKTSAEAAAMFGMEKTACLDELKRRGIACRAMSGEQWSIRISARWQGVAVEDWKGFTSSQSELLASSQEYKDWRKSVFARDRFCCVECGKKRVELHAHHIFRKSAYPQLTFEIDNGVTLCEKCHNKVHGKEELFQERYLAKIGSNVRPLKWFGESPMR